MEVNEPVDLTSHPTGVRGLKPPVVTHRGCSLGRTPNECGLVLLKSAPREWRHRGAPVAGGRRKILRLYIEGVCYIASLLRAIINLAAWRLSVRIAILKTRKTRKTIFI